MVAQSQQTETILIVDDEDSVRRTIQEWLKEEPDLQVLSTGDVEGALRLAEEHEIDLAILDWNLGAGLNGLELLQDLYEFNPNIIAIMITAYADLATPLDAMRHGVRDYLDKNQELNRENFLFAVRRQLNYIRPAKRERRLHQSLVTFRNAIDKILPLVESLEALTDPVTLPEAIAKLFQFLKNLTHARDGILVVRHFDPQKQPAESFRVYDSEGQVKDHSVQDFPKSIAASAISLQEPCTMTDLSAQVQAGAVELQNFEKDHFSLLAAPLAVAPGTHVVLELFDKQTADGNNDPAGFNENDLRLVRDAGELGAELLRQTLGQRQMHKVLLDAVEAALHASESVRGTMGRAEKDDSDQAFSQGILEQLRQGLHETSEVSFDSETSVRLAEAIRLLAVRHGTPALQHCLALVENLKTLLDAVTGY